MGEWIRVGHKHWIYFDPSLFEEWFSIIEGTHMPIDKPFAYHKPSPEGLDKINKLREHFSEGERLMKEICPQSRQLSVALTNNETTAMWAIKAVVFNDPNSQITE